MTSDPNVPPANEQSQSGSVPPPWSRESKPKPGSLRYLLAILLGLFLGLFLADAIVSLADDSFVLLFNFHLFAGLRTIVCLFAMLMAIVVYILMGLTPMIPKRWFLPLTLFYPATQLALVPFLIYCFGRLQQVSWGFSCSQVVLGLGIFCWIQGGLKLRWPLVLENQLAGRGFSWRNLFVFGLANVFGLLPATFVCLFLCTAIAVGHFSDGFMALRPGGLTVQVRKYVRNDGKTIELFPMSHVADGGFYQKVSQTFPTNSIILMEGVSDKKNLLTNGISYKRMAKFLGLTEQKVAFGHGRGKMVLADIDVDQFSTNTIDFLNLIMLFHAQGVNAGNVLMLMQYSPPPGFEEQLYDDLLRKRNQHLLEGIQSHLSQTDNIMVPWGVAHMPGIAREIQKSGFRLDETKEFMVIRFRGF